MSGECEKCSEHCLDCRCRRKKQRIEDLGRLSILLDRISDNELFDLYEKRPKDFSEWFENLPKEQKDDILHEMAYRIRQVHDDLCECVVIARGDEE